MLRAAMFGMALALPGCFGDQPDSYGLSFGSYSASPVVVTRLAVNGRDFQMVPLLVDARSDEVMPRASGGLYSLPWPKGRDGQAALEVTWVELPTSRAYTASAQVAIADLMRGASNTVYLAPVFGPNGLLLVTSDPLPQSESDQPTRDLAQLCAARSPGDDVDYRATPDSLPDLANVLAERRPGFGDTICPQPER